MQIFFSLGGGHIACPRCASISFHVVKEGKDPWTGEPFQVYACNNCEAGISQAPSERGASDNRGSEALGEGNAPGEPEDLVSPAEGQGEKRVTGAIGPVVPWTEISGMVLCCVGWSRNRSPSGVFVPPYPTMEWVRSELLGSRFGVFPSQGEGRAAQAEAEAGI